MSNEHIYILSGLGADESVFAKLNLPINHSFIQWIPEQHRESLKHYALRISEQIKHDDIILIGLSFGGIVAQEIAAIRKVKAIVLLSSVKSRSQLSTWYKFATFVKITYFLPKFLLTNTSILLNYMFSLKTEDEKKLLKRIVGGNKASHFRWALDHIGNWQGPKSNALVIQIHGTEDRILRIRLIKGAFEIKGGGHFMPYTHSEMLNPLLVDQLSRIHD